MSPKIDIVTQKTASKEKLVIGVQFGLCGVILRIGIYY